MPLQAPYAVIAGAAGRKLCLKDNARWVCCRARVSNLCVGLACLFLWRFSRPFSRPTFRDQSFGSTSCKVAPKWKSSGWIKLGTLKLPANRTLVGLLLGEDWFKRDSFGCEKRTVYFATISLASRALLHGGSNAWRPRRERLMLFVLCDVHHPCDCNPTGPLAERSMGSCSSMSLCGLGWVCKAVVPRVRLSEVEKLIHHRLYSSGYGGLRQDTASALGTSEEVVVCLQQCSNKSNTETTPATRTIGTTHQQVGTCRTTPSHYIRSFEAVSAAHAARTFNCEAHAVGAEWCEGRRHVGQWRGEISWQEFFCNWRSTPVLVWIWIKFARRQTSSKSTRQEGLTLWEVDWSTEKMDYCCRWTGDTFTFSDSVYPFCLKDLMCQNVPMLKHHPVLVKVCTSRSLSIKLSQQR